MSDLKTAPLKPIYFGDTWDGMTVDMTATGTALDSPIASIRMHFRDESGNVGLELSSTSGITITDAAAWQFTVNKIDRFPLAIGQWYWSIECTASDNGRKTRTVGTKEVLDDATQ